MSKRNHTGEWAKLGRDLWTHPKVRRIADLIGRQWQMELPLSAPDNSRTSPGQMRTIILVHAVVSGLIHLFLTINRHASEAGDGSQDAILSDMTMDNYLDDASGLPGLQAAMIAVGWAVHDKQAATIRLPNYLEHNVLAKGVKRAGARGDSDSPEARRKREQRARSREHGAGQKPGQTPANYPLSGPDKGGQRPDNETVKRSEESSKTHVEKKVLFGGQAGEPAASTNTGDGSRLPLMVKVDDLRPDSWGTVTHWSAADCAAFQRACSALETMAPHGWKLLAWFFRWCRHPWNVEHRAEETRVTGSRAKFLDGLADYHARASRLWHAEKRPDLEPKAKPPKSGPAEPLPPPTPEEAERNVAEFRARLKEERSGPANVPDQATASEKRGQHDRRSTSRCLHPICSPLVPPVAPE